MTDWDLIFNKVWSLRSLDFSKNICYRTWNTRRDETFFNCSHLQIQEALTHSQKVGDGHRVSVERTTS